MAYSKGEVKMVVVVVMAVMMVGAEAAISCGTADGYVSGCLTYLIGTASAPSSGCCSGVQQLYSVTKNSRSDRITACGCLVSVAKGLGNKLISSRSGDVASKCGVQLGYTPSVNINCNTIP